MTSSTAERVKGHFVLERLGERRLKTSPISCKSTGLSSRECMTGLYGAAKGSRQSTSAIGRADYGVSDARSWTCRANSFSSLLFRWDMGQ